MNDASTDVKLLPDIAQPPAEQPMSLVERLARDPSVDVNKLGALLAMEKEARAEAAQQAFNVAMNAAQSKMRPIAADADNPQTRSRYATYAKLDRALRPIYTGEGFSISYDTGVAASADEILVLAYVSHTAGHTRTYKMPMAADGKGAKGGDVMTKTHAKGAGMSYGMRYLLKMIFNVAVGEDDVDGNAPLERVNEEQESNIQAKVEEVGANKPAFLKWVSSQTKVKVSSYADIPANAYTDCINMLNAKARQGR